jgi:16S rRNA (uracil1498-N3)-methyltransferase
MRRRFLVDSFEAGRAVVRGEDARHLGRVLRARPGQIYELSDGSAVWLAKVAEVQPDSVEFELLKPIEAAKLHLDVTLLLSIIRFAHFEWALEKATEMGVTSIQPVAAVRTDLGLLEAAPKRQARWEKIAREAAQQARRLAPPRIFPLLNPAEAFSQSPAELKLMLSERLNLPPLESFRPSAQIASAALAFGPEGGWTDREAALARETGFQEASLGPLILRTETAVVAALAILLCSWHAA